MVGAVSSDTAFFSLGLIWLWAGLVERHLSVLVIVVSVNGEGGILMSSIW